jgi:hypothetical protein
MILEVIRSTADWLDDNTNGVNARLSGLPQDGSDADPPDLAVVADETRSGIAARRHVPQDQTTPLLMVFQPSPAELEAWVTTAIQDAEEVTVAYAYVARNVDSEEVVEDALYTMRAVKRAISDLMDPANVASRTRNNIVILNTTRMSLIPTATQLEDAVATHVFLVGYRARDEAPIS